MAERYKVVLGSESAHCCFDATVVDTTRPIINADGNLATKFGSNEIYYKAVCECFDIEAANQIAAALNR